jgi:soluble lytic murein transglycosylase
MFNIFITTRINQAVARSCAWTWAWAAIGAALLIAGNGPAGATPLDPFRPRAKTDLVTADAPAGPLGARDVGLYRRIFAYQNIGAWQRADQLIAQLSDRLLLGHAEWQRYMHPDAYRSSFEELRAWLEQYSDHPGADRVYRLAKKRRPRGTPAPKVPVRGYLGGSGQERQEVIRAPYRSTRERTAEEEALIDGWRERIEKLAASRQPEAAATRLQAVRRRLDHTEIDLARWQIGRSYFAVGDDLKAITIARGAAVRSGDIVPEMHWVPGIAAWRLGRIDLATRHFRALALDEAAHPAERARAAFWAARAYVIAQKPPEVGRFLRIAAEDGQSFYGLLARAVLGEDGNRYRGEEAKAGPPPPVAKLPGVRRALALVQVGNRDLAEQEIRKLAARSSPKQMEGLIAVTRSLDLPAAQMRLAQSLRQRRGLDHHDGLYPLPGWRPATGFKVDRALLYAVMRAESGFDPEAESHVGARGLMQIMPATARGIAARVNLELGDSNALFEPVTSMLFGQAYLDQILELPWVERNLILAAIAYNAGPRRAMQWRKSLDVGDDPLLFLESIPLVETRIYVKNVLTNFWTYRERLGQQRPSLKALTGGAWPMYQPLDSKPALHAWN